MIQSTPALAPAVAAHRDWADELADTIIQQLAVFARPGPGPRALVAAHLRVVKQEGRCEGVDKASQAVQQAFDARRGAA